MPQTELIEAVWGLRCERIERPSPTGGVDVQFIA